MLMLETTCRKHISGTANKNLEPQKIKDEMRELVEMSISSGKKTKCVKCGGPHLVEAPILWRP